ncbi:unnamed protein product [Peronospora destructor]|uniref:Deoxyribodipyrimidine photo-lyase n=1 Tax=Peronospora destructor TaxID=86335 RepID=A0AAV0V7J6_9STRA|nr:unnamed protein product [Peronospora destructor]
MVNVRRTLEKLGYLVVYSTNVSNGCAKAPSLQPKGGRYLLYWMQTSVHHRLSAVITSGQKRTNGRQKPFKMPVLLRFVTERHGAVCTGRFNEAHQRLADRGLNLDVFHHQHKSGDCPYLRPWRSALDNLVSSVKEAEDTDDENAGFGIVQIEGDVVVPAAVVTDKEEYAARTIRPKVTKHLDRFVVPLKSLVIEKANRTEGTSLLTLVDSSELKPLDVTSLKAVSKALELLDVDHDVKGVDWHFRGGEAAASACAKKFLTPDRLARFATERNEPSRDAGSDLSVYLRYGHISVVRVALAANKLKGVARAKEGLASFLEELIVRRELSVNLVAYNQDNYDSMRCLPNYAQVTLREHADDKRDQLYSREQLEHFKTGDRLWNAAQRELVVSGKMHGYMRMYWGKKLLEWTQTPEEGFNAALVLNNKYALDAPDPNSYAGVAWVFGKHDQGWRERAIFGKVRYMNEAGLKRKFRMDAYVLKVGRIAAKAKKGTGEEEPTTPEEEAEPAKPQRKKTGTRSAESDAAGSAKKKKLQHK